MNLPQEERERLIEAEWQQPEAQTGTEKYSTEIKIYANNRIGMFVDISKVFTERQIDITSMNVRTSKQGKATIVMTFDIHGIEELNKLSDKLRQIEGVLDIENCRISGSLYISEYLHPVKVSHIIRRKRWR